MSTAAAQDDRPSTDSVEAALRSAAERFPAATLAVLTEFVKSEVRDRRVTEASVRRKIEMMIATGRLFKCAIPGKAPVYFATAEELGAAVRADVEARARAKSNDPHNDNATDVRSIMLRAELHSKSPNAIRAKTLEDFRVDAARTRAALGIPQPTPSGDPDIDVLADVKVTLGQQIISTPDGSDFIALPDPLKPGSKYIRAKKVQEVLIRDLTFPGLPHAPGTPIYDQHDPAAQPLREISILAPAGWVYDGGIEFSHIDTTGRFRFQCWPRLSIEPIFNEKVDRLFQCWGPDQYPIICDFLTHSVQTQLPSVAVGLAGDNSAGKDFLLKMAAGLYSPHCVVGRGDLATGHFNDSIVESPYAICSEGLPRDGWKRELISAARLKDAISRDVHKVNQKHVQPVDLFGNLRWGIPFNGSAKDLFPTTEVLPVSDIDAICKRFVILETRKESAEYLRSLGGIEGTTDWIKGPRHAVHHIAWIVANHVIPPERADGRFGLKARSDEMRRFLRTNTPTAQSIITGVVGFIAGDPDRHSLVDAIEVGGGAVAVNVGQLAHHWTSLNTGAAAAKTPPQESTISSEVTRLSLDGERPSATHPENGRTYVQLENDLIIGHARDIGLNVDEIGGRITLPREEFMAWRAGTPRRGVFVMKGGRR